MPRSLKVVFSFGGFLILLLALQDLTYEFPLKEFITHAMPHLVIVATSVIVGGVLLWIIEEAIEHQITPAIIMGLRTVATQVASEVKQFPERSWKGFTEIIEELKVKHIVTPGVQELVSAGKIEEAVQKSKKDNEERHDEELTVLLLSKEPKDWETGVRLLEKTPNPNPRFFLSFAYLFWSASTVERSIEIAEKGLAIAVRQGEDLYIRKFQNSLAYYYAETRDPKYAAKAKEFVAAARSANPEAAATFDTEGLVKITFGTTKEEIMAGVASAEEAHRRGIPFKYYVKALTLAKERLELLGLV